MARAVELAAGESRRMGAPVEQVAVVLGHRAAVIRQAVPADPKVPVCVNERYPERMLTSHARGGRPGAGIVGGGEDHAVPGGGPVPRGDVSVYIKSLLPAPVLLVIGAGHVGQMVAQLGAMAGRVLCGP
ncbi:MAG TPA: hypothetical protein VK464_28455, partial [Symbiobacteriaceae bacterium]|nr:hypothetical protein [Symbiobacteriaceae bacterium]